VIRISQDTLSGEYLAVQLGLNTPFEILHSDGEWKPVQKDGNWVSWRQLKHLVEKVLASSRTIALCAAACGYSAVHPDHALAAL